MELWTAVTARAPRVAADEFLDTLVLAGDAPT
jgi:hypothetical protein